jgi:hypothetical protein
LGTNAQALYQHQCTPDQVTCDPPQGATCTVSGPPTGAGQYGDCGWHTVIAAGPNFSAACPGAQGSLQVFRIKNYGAIEQGRHKFCYTKTDKCFGEAHCFILWHHLKDDKWQAARIF